MKTKIFFKISLIAIAILLGTRVNTFADADSFIVVQDKVIVNVSTAKKEKVLSLRIANIQQQLTTVQIESDLGEVFFNQLLEGQNAYAKSINLDVLQQGNYRLIVERHYTNTIQEFEVPFKGPIRLLDKTVEFKPLVQQGEGIVQVYFDEGIADEVNVAFLDENSVPVFKDRFYVTTRSLKRFNVEELKPGQYTIRIDLPTKTFHETAVIE